MLLDIPTDHLGSDLVPHRPNKIPIFPEFSAPQTAFDPWELAKDGAGASALKPRHDLCDGVAWREGTKNMDMVWTHLHLFNGDVVLLCNIGTKFLYPPLNLAWQNITPVFGRPDQMVLCIVDSMRCASKNHTVLIPLSIGMWQGASSPLPHALIPPRRKQRGSLRIFRAMP